MAEYIQASNVGAAEGWFIEKSTNDMVYLDSSGNVRLRVDNATGNLTVPGTLSVTGTTAFTGNVDINGGAIDGVTIGGASAPTVTDLGSVATCDINGGAIDGAAIGANSASTGAFTTLSTTGAMTTTSGVGAVAADGTLTSEEGGGGQHLTKLTFTDTLSVAGAALAAGALSYTMPAVPCMLRGAYMSGTLTAATETGTPEIGLGTVVGAGANATLGAVGTTSEDLIEGTASEAFSSGGTAFTRNSLVAKLPLILAASAVIHVNYALTYTATEDVTVAGTLWLDWVELG
jgi:hypothetical protein